MNRPLLFVYGTLRPGFDGPMAHWLADRAEWIGAGWIGGKLYQVADYPGFVPGEVGRVRGDLFALPDAEGCWRGSTPMRNARPTIRSRMNIAANAVWWKRRMGLSRPGSICTPCPLPDIG